MFLLNHSYLRNDVEAGYFIDAYNVENKTSFVFNWQIKGALLIYNSHENKSTVIESMLQYITHT